MDTKRAGHADIGRLGIWSTELSQADAGIAAEAAAELERVGWGALWLAGGAGPGIWERSQALLAASERIAVAHGVLSIWTPDADNAAREFARITHEYGPRLLAGFGVSSPAGAAAAGKRYGTPLSAMNSYLDSLDAADGAPKAADRIIGALGPRMTALAGRRAAGVHPFLVTPESNAASRALLGPEALIATHQAVVLESEPGRARDIARAGVGAYFGYPNYQANLRRLGFGDEDLVPGGSDRLIDAVVAWGTIDEIARRVMEHHAAGADHVALHVLTAEHRWPGSDWLELSALAPLAKRATAAT